jgi:DNA-binding LytR/AlgR family response regulator
LNLFRFSRGISVRCIFSIQWFFVFVQEPDFTKEWTLPAMLRNPIFIAGILSVLAYGNYMLEKWLKTHLPSKQPISFFSGYRKVSLSREDILYIESRDSEVWIIARDGQTYRNRNGISQWENLLGEGFLRIHRAFLVNISHATLSTPDTVLVGGKELPVSRKKKETVKAVLQKYD